MNTINNIDDGELEELTQSAREQGKELSRQLTAWREADLAGYPEDGIHTACLIAALIPVADTLSARSEATFVDDAVREATDVLKGMLQRRSRANQS